MAKVYRLETPKGLGIYHLLKGELRGKYRGQRHPGPYGDPQISPKWSQLDSEALHKLWRFGFSSKASLKRWFFCKKDRQKFVDDLGIVCSVYEVPSKFFQRGTAQAIFKEAAAKKVGELPTNLWV